MPQHHLAPARVCPDCDGFASVHVTLGGRTSAGILRTVTAYCRACHGTGTVPALRVLAAAAATAVFARR
ncbi:hypothetical protein NLX86_31820 [Streptomyces sp. A3M-1-3]|uniref:hypothetical protein n=1 Tax=Streptomyces sp. A3M-1-3 TaxID=2962044 RepID=UPI0020B775A8|nr:hypothetical protein [Streptomyces sp. A3M-1-3]MCP3822511.1 hypothetical protein [Streptomyces sp. A3M-1-3]